MKLLGNVGKYLICLFAYTFMMLSYGGPYQMCRSSFPEEFIYLKRRPLSNFEVLKMRVWGIRCRAHIGTFLTRSIWMLVRGRKNEGNRFVDFCSKLRIDKNVKCCIFKNKAQIPNMGPPKCASSHTYL